MSRHRLLYTLVAMVILLATGATQHDEVSKFVSTKAVSASAAQPAISNGFDYHVIKVVDGDTVDVEKDGVTTRLRLIGMDTPEIVDPRKPVQCFAREASDKAKQLLNGQTVRIELDPSQGEHDKYGRSLAYLFFATDTQAGTLYNQYMIAEGYAHEYTYDMPYKYQSAFKAAERKAREEDKGLWAPQTCGGDTTQAAAST